VAETERLEYPEGHHGEHRDWDRGTDRESGLQTEVGIRRPEDHAKQDTRHDGLEREFRQRLTCRDDGDVLLSLLNDVGGWRQLPAGHSNLLSRGTAMRSKSGSPGEAMRRLPAVNTAGSARGRAPGLVRGWTP